MSMDRWRSLDNEITAIPALLELLDISGYIITIDAMGTQTEIAHRIKAQGADYILALKANHPTLYQEVMFYLSSLPPEAQQLGKAIRQHWSIENQLHWVLDVIFGEDACRIRTGNAPENIALLKRWSINLLNQETSFKRSTRQKARRAGMDKGYLLKVLAASIPLQSNLSNT
jgi:predicted transposase YbfD/YdcC